MSTYLHCGSVWFFDCLFLRCSWQPETKFPYSQIRFPPKPTNSKLEFAEGDEVEVYSRSNEQEALGWWKAQIKVRTGGNE